MVLFDVHVPDITSHLIILQEKYIHGDSMRLIPKNTAVSVRQRSLFVVLLLAAVLTLSACNSSNATTDTESMVPQAPAQAVDVLVLRPQSLILSAELAGRVSPYTIAEVRPQVDGIVLAREFREGADIVKGEVLYRIDPAIYQVELASAKATLAQSDASLKVAKSKASRYQNLLASKAVSQQEYDEADALYKQATAVVELNMARLQRAQINLDYTEVKSPIEGRIGRSSVTQGALVTANQEASLATVQQLDPVYVDLTQSSAELLRLRQQLALGNQQEYLADDIEVRLELEDGTIYPHVGRLAFSEVSVTESTGSFTLRAVFPNPNQWLLPGMFVRAKVDTASIDNALMLPPLAVSRTAKGAPSVLVVSPESTVQLRVLDRAEMHNGKWLVNGGVDVGDRVIVGGLQKVFPGMPVLVGEVGAGTGTTVAGDSR